MLKEYNIQLEKLFLSRGPWQLFFVMGIAKKTQKPDFLFLLSINMINKCKWIYMYQ